jgi:hypothetical protein
MSSGSLAGFPVVDVTATLYDGSYHEVDSSALAFQIAARGAFRDAMGKCSAKLLEPVMKVRGAFGVQEYREGTHAVQKQTDNGCLWKECCGGGRTVHSGEGVWHSSRTASDMFAPEL